MITRAVDVEKKWPGGLFPSMLPLKFKHRRANSYSSLTEQTLCSEGFHEIERLPNHCLLQSMCFSFSF
uniref:Uncharacterized protein n=1 Tax=Octopus bimaculoides TaxID=37653 RepID=A0A0L8G263_OCTBM